MLSNAEQNSIDSADGSDAFDLSQDIADILASFSPKKTTEAPNQSRLNHESGSSGKRAHYRHPVRWRVAIVNKSSGAHEIYHGRTFDVSLSGISILLERNVLFTSEVVVLLAIPPMHQGQKETLVEIQSSLTHSVLDSVHNQFRLGMRFIQFKGEGQRILSDVLSKRHIPKQEPNPYVNHILAR